MAAVESGEVDGTEELQSSLANVSLNDDDELLCRTLEYDLSMRLIVAHQIQQLKFDLKKRINVYGSLLRDLDGESDRMRHRVAAGWAARELDADDENLDDELKDDDDSYSDEVNVDELKDDDDSYSDELKDDDDDDSYDELKDDELKENVDDGLKDDDDDEEEEEEAEKTTVALREFRDMYIKASGLDDRDKEFDEMVWVHYDPDLDNETRKATVARLWHHIEKELDDRSDAVTSGEFKYTYAPLPPRQQPQSL